MSIGVEVFSSSSFSLPPILLVYFDGWEEKKRMKKEGRKERQGGKNPMPVLLLWPISADVRLCQIDSSLRAVLR